MSEAKFGRKVIVHYLSGEVKRGVAVDFSPRKFGFHLNSLDNHHGKCDFVVFDKVKAVFFVRNLSEAKHQRLGNNINQFSYGNSVLVKFKDGEIIQGLCRQLMPNNSGFFILPEDPYSNNESIFISYRAVDSIIKLRNEEPKYSGTLAATRAI